MVGGVLLPIQVLGQKQKQVYEHAIWELTKQNELRFFSAHLLKDLCYITGRCAALLYDQQLTALSPVRLYKNPLPRQKSQ